MGEMRNAYTILVGRPRHVWKDNIRMSLKEIVHGVVYGVHVADSCKHGNILVLHKK